MNYLPALKTYVMMCMNIISAATHNKQKQPKEQYLVHTMPLQVTFKMYAIIKMMKLK